MRLEDKQINNFQNRIFSWWEENKRELPWRNTTDPYKIMISEFMLQQTQVIRVTPKYNEFITKYPTMSDLANSNRKELLKVWSGLGYNRRALWLKEAAIQILLNGEFPKTNEELIRLKGIGEYTSRSILIFAYNKNIATVDTNIRRILIYENFATEKMNKKELIKIAEEILPRNQSRDWHNALMDYGSLFLSTKNSKIKPITKQEKFDGSKRQLRGKLLKFIINNNSKADINNIKDYLGISYLKAKKIVEELINDKLIEERNGQYYT